jgi:hypothetical protein
MHRRFGFLPTFHGRVSGMTQATGEPLQTNIKTPVASAIPLTSASFSDYFPN